MSPEKVSSDPVSYKPAYASVTFALRQVYDACKMSKSPFPCGLRRETLRSSYGFTWPLRFCLTPHNDKFEKIVSP